MAHIPRPFCTNLHSNLVTTDEWTKEFEKKFLRSWQMGWGNIIYGMDFAKDYEQTKIKEMKTVKVIPQQEETISAVSAVPNLCYFLDRKQSRTGIAVSSCNGWRILWAGKEGSESLPFTSFSELVKEVTSNTSSYHDIIVMQIQK